jgi:PKD repeat protein
MSLPTNIYTLIRLLVVLSSCYFNISIAQNSASKWYFGRHAALDFSTSPPTILANSSMTTISTSASLADTAGKLLFYTDGKTVWDQTHQVMANGSNMSPTTGWRSAVFLPDPGNSTRYYLFLYSHGGNNYSLTYSIIDMTLASGMGSVTVKANTVTNSADWTFAATKHCNNVDYWIVTHNPHTNQFRSYQLTATGVNTIASLSSGGAINTTTNVIYTIKISPDGKRLAKVNTTASVELFDFDLTTGLVSNPMTFTVPTLPPPKLPISGCEFSPDGSKLYCSGHGTGNIYQWDICAGSYSAIASSQYTVANVWPLITAQMQLAPDGKIYVARRDQQNLGVINSPNASGAACNYVDGGQSVGTGTVHYDLPNFSADLFRYKSAPFVSAFDNSKCATVSFTLPPPISLSVCSAPSYSVLSHYWDFDDTLSGSQNISTSNNPSHTFVSNGTYKVKLVLNYNCFSDTLVRTYTVSGYPQLFITGNTLICTGKSSTLSATGGTNLKWSNNLSGANAVVSPSQTTNYAVTGQSSSDSTCKSTASITVFVSDSFPDLSVSGRLVICKGETTKLTATGASSFHWLPNIYTATFSVKPSSSTTYAVLGTDPGNPCTAEKQVTITVNPCLGISEGQDQLVVTIFPNPSNGLFNVRAEVNAALRVYDALGRELINRNVFPGTSEIDLNGYADGLYFAEVISSNSKRVIRLQMITN